MFYLVNEVNFIKYINYFYKLNLKPSSSINLVRGGTKEGQGGSFTSLARNCKQIVIQASSPLTKKQNFKFLKIFFSNFKIPFTRKS